MTQEEWLAEVQRRIAISEGCEARAYYDPQGVLTVGIGFNLQRSDAMQALHAAGVADPAAILSRTASLTPEQISKLFAYSFAPVVSEARASLAEGIFDALTPSRRFVICDLVYNLGNAGWLQFVNTRALINQAQQAKNEGRASAHALFVEAGEHLRASVWFGQVGYRAMRDVAMLIEGVWCDPNGDGGDIE